MKPRAQAALAGVLAAGVALGVSELVCGLVKNGPSLISAIGTEFIDRFAASLKQLAVDLFGTNDKAALVVGIVVMSLALGAVLGVLSRSRLLIGAIGFVGFGGVGVWAFLNAPGRHAGVGIAAGVLAAAAGIGVLALLRPSSTPARAAAVPPEPHEALLDPVMDGVASGTTLVASPVATTVLDPRNRASSRRTILAMAGVGGVAVATGTLGRRIRTDGTVESFRRQATIPKATSTRPPPPTAELGAIGVSPYVTPTADFYRIDTALTVPAIDATSWRLRVGGLVDRPFSISYDELLALDAVEEVVTLQCVSNEVGGRLVGNAVWQGVPLTTLLARAGVRPEASQIVGRSADRWTAGFPTGLASDGRVALVAYAMNGAALPVSHGFPARLVVAGLYGYVSATKWLEEIELTTWDGVDGYWISRGWSKEGPIKTASRIDVPRAGARLVAGPNPVAGVAWAPSRGVSAVEVRIDGGSWMPCRLGDVASENTWVQWIYDWDATPGDHVISVRAHDGTGAVQTGDVRPPEPDGATGWHTRRVRVER